VFAGSLTAEEVLSCRDAAGVVLGDALGDIGYTASNIPGVSAPILGNTDAYVEIHVEQGSRLESTSTQIGLVAGSWAAYKYDLRFTGEQSHTGATPMEDRRDALLAAATVIIGVNALTRGVPEFHTSATELEASPRSPNVVTASATMHVELRAPETDVLNEAESKLFALLAKVERDLSVSVTISRQWHRSPGRYWQDGVDLARHCADRIGLTWRELYTISGHDSIPLSAVVPTVMLFTPSAGGWAHNSKELTIDEDMIDGVAMMTEVLKTLCGKAER
jgi:N-carbamoyl-L-amino-acid hydrolase